MVLTHEQWKTLLDELPPDKADKALAHPGH
jgi:hypothetical protein